ncbi:ester cyclase [Nostoc spongiaeforme FACHB-130]|uniref:Ester cyclase n=1 Tax=Nostoc spongiaeforme FACHB-130 TaxID=1357510 RepID=A0ABR8FNZ5_9NOSO|nr:ester cyclase [Nostoc spongiaeforme]MBD2593138.1 ester cyclase [Nostoc spongiaeforme FACHB-130]
MTEINIENLPLWVQERDIVLKYNTQATWRYGEQPDYTRSNENLAKESLCNHPANSLEKLVQNLVRTFDIEANFKTNPQEWLSVVQDKFRMSTNGGTSYTLEDLVQAGTYKLLIGKTQHYQAPQEDFESSTQLFHTAFPDGFLWEVLEVYSAPPTIAFKWRHWGHFRGNFKDYVPTGQMIEVVGMSIVQVTENCKILSLEHYYDNGKFLNQLTSGGKMGNATQQQLTPAGTPSANSGKTTFLGFFRRFLPNRTKPASANTNVSGCPFAALLR